MVDEESFFSLLIANERVEKWLADIRAKEARHRVKIALEELSSSCNQEAYAEEVCNAPACLNSLLEPEEQEQLSGA